MLIGTTLSSDFPFTHNALDTSYNGCNTAYPWGGDYFISVFDSTLSKLVYSTYLGGSSMDCGRAIAVDATGNAYVTGFTYSSNFPTVNALQKKLACTNSFYFNANAFIAKIGPGGTNLVYSTYFGGTNFDTGKGIAVDAFADRIGTGNPAGVCLLREPADPPGCRQLPGR